MAGHRPKRSWRPSGLPGDIFQVFVSQNQNFGLHISGAYLRSVFPD
jgi:hypothetical protein